MIAERILTDSRILIVDDSPANITILERMLEWSGYTNIRSITNAQNAVHLFNTYSPDLVILDLHMPAMSGYEVLAEMKRQVDHGYVPVLVFTADCSVEARQKALSLGASDFLTKPGDAMEISLRVRNFLQTRHLNREMEEKNKELEQKVEQRTRALWTSQIEILDRLARASQLKQNMKSERPQRLAELCCETARAIGWDHSRIELIRLAAPLHDIGKLTTPDYLLTKAGKLSPDEEIELQHHTISGAEILSGGRTPLLLMAESIARHHHEAWDGTGYPDKLEGEKIPLAARIVGLVDSFLTLTDGTPYQREMDPTDALVEITAGCCKQFDPTVLEAFLASLAPAAQRVA